MNFFDMIFKNRNSQEFVFSSVYNYLVDKTESHGLGSLVLERVLKNLPKLASDTSIGKPENISSHCKDYRVTAEQDFGSQVGIIDSFIEFYESDNKIKQVFATEVKILAGSVKNISGGKSQLVRYSDYLESKYKDKYIFLYLVPYSQKAVDEFEAFLKPKPDEKKKFNYIMYWGRDAIQEEKQNVDDTDIKPNVCPKPFSDLLLEILQEDSSGVLSPLSTEIHYVIRSLINIIRNNFNRVNPEPTELQRFPDRKQFNENIKKHWDLYDYLETGCNEARQPISSTKTSIGFPFGSASHGKYNTLFRVLTMTKYSKDKKDIKSEDYAHGLIIELEKNIYDESVIKKLGEDLSSVAKIVPGKHPNEKEDIEVNWIVFNDAVTLTDTVKEKLDSMYKQLSDAFLQWLQK